MSKVAIARCADYDPEELNKGVGEVLGLLGGLDKFIKPNEKVLIKPNLLSAREPKDGVTTHPEFIRTLIKRLKPISKNIKIGDSPGGFGSNMDEIYEKSGVKKMAAEEGIELVKFDKSRKVGRLPVACEVLDADKIISLPKFKTHDVLIITAGVKNMYGIIPGVFKARQHAIAPRRKDMAPIIVEAFSIRKPDLTIIDAVISMHGEGGPSRGRLLNTNFILASSDAVAIDSVLMKITGRDPLTLYTNQEARKKGLGQTDLNKIEVLGNSIDEVKIDNFEFAKTGFLNKVPRPLLWLIKYLINFRVGIDSTKCLRCKLCEESCPVNAITINKDKCVINTSKCLLCLCCNEICPHDAVLVKKSWFAKMLWGA